MAPVIGVNFRRVAIVIKVGLFSGEVHIDVMKIEIRIILFQGFFLVLLAKIISNLKRRRGDVLRVSIYDQIIMVIPKEALIQLEAILS